MEPIGSAARRLPTPAPSSGPAATKDSAPPPAADFSRDTFAANANAERAAPVRSRPPPDSAFDGHLVGPDGRTHRPGTPLDRVAPGDGPLIIQVNGINTDVAGQLQEMQRLQQ